MNSNTANAIALTIEQIILQTCPCATMREMYGGSVFETAPGNSNTRVCGYFKYKNYVSLEFTHGAKLTDLGNILEGSGKTRRHIKLKDPSDVKLKNVCAF